MNLHRPNAAPLEPTEAAAYWVARRRLGLMTPRDEASFESWRAEPENAALFDAADEVVEETGAIAAFPDVRRMRETALVQAPPRSDMRWRQAAAAAVAAGLLGGALWLGDMPAAPPSVPAAETAAVAKRYETKVGERLNVRLDDGSVVAMNTASVMEVAYTAGRRDVRLVQGQAMFQVAKNRERPFIVTAGDRQVTAVGTAFDVRLDSGDVKVVLVEGKVVVDPVERVGIEKLAPRLARRELDAGEQLVASADRRVRVSEADTDRATSWRRGQVIFRDDTLAAAVAELNRYSDRKIVLDDPKMGDLRVSGVFGAARGENFIAALTSFYPIDSQDRAHGGKVLVWRDGGPADEKSSPAS